MFTGIIEHMGEVIALRPSGTNLTFDLRAPFPDPIQVDQSIAHNGVCLTVTEIHEQSIHEQSMSGAFTLYSVTAVQETLEKTNLGSLKVGSLLNIERCLKVGDRLDGHFVQGHVDDTARVTRIENRDGSWMFHFDYAPRHQHLLVDKGSICVNGVSLTVVEAHAEHFSVAIIPYTYEHTNFKQLAVGDRVNLEFDVLGKYIAKFYQQGVAPKLSNT